MNYSMKKEDLPPFLESLKKKFEVIVPAENDTGIASYQPYQGQEIYLKNEKLSSPKYYFRPYKEKIFSFKKTGKSVSITPVFDTAKRLIFGVRPCDTHALKVLDELFIRYYGDDQFYSARRKNTVIIALACNQACKNGFCTSMGTSQPAGHDLLFFETGDFFYVKPETEQGKALIDKKFFKQTSDAEPSPKIDCNKELETKGLGKNLYKNFQHPVWKEESERCLSCSSCTQVCPTCYCYITDDEFKFGSDSESERFRFLDSCQLKRFTTVAGNHVFRESRTARLRQFVLHKLSYYEENHGMQLCVGCGRCISVCPVKIDLTKIANTIQENPLEGTK
jgi:ferredoxin